MRADALVVGAGAAGVASAAMLGRRGLRAIVLERESCTGASWAHRYDGLRLNTVRWMSALPGLGMGREHGRWPTRDAWAAYLRRYAQHHELDVRYGVHVTRIDATPSDFVVRSSLGPVESPVVVVATGHDHTPVIPDWPGAEHWATRMIHSSAYRSPGPLTDKHVLVVGAGNSACEIATLATAAASSVSIAVRTPPLILRREYGGVPLTVLGAAASLLPDRLVDVGGRVLSRVTVGDLSSFGLPPSPRGLSAMRRTYWAPPVDSGFVDAVKRGAIDVVPAVDSFTAAEAVLADGSRLRPDVVIAATGYSTGLRPLVGHLGVLDHDDEPAGRQPAPGLFFAGFTYGLTALLPHVGRDARWIGRTAAASVGSAGRAHEDSPAAP